MRKNHVSVAAQTQETLLSRNRGRGGCNRVLCSGSQKRGTAEASLSRHLPVRQPEKPDSHGELTTSRLLCVLPWVGDRIVGPEMCQPVVTAAVVYLSTSRNQLGVGTLRRVLQSVMDWRRLRLQAEFPSPPPFIGQSNAFEFPVPVCAGPRHAGPSLQDVAAVSSLCDE